MNGNESATADLFNYVESLSDGSLHCRYDRKTGLKAIIAIDNTNLGPALGGCRCLPYSTSEAALKDAVRLARGMTYKAAVSGLAFGGGKSVLIYPPNLKDRKAFFAAFGEFVDTLGGRYITALDSGTTNEDLAIVASKTKHVAGMKAEGFPTGDPSPFTALGVFHGIEAAVKHQLNRTSLDGVHIAIQGLGHVGYSLAKLAHEHGATLTVSDINKDAVAKAVAEFGAKECDTNEIHKVACDVFAPCALGAILNPNSIPELKCKIVAGAANNQLANIERDGMAVHKLGILYAPDYVINAAGLIYATEQYLKTSEQAAVKKIARVNESLSIIFDRASSSNRPTSLVADELAEERLAKA